MYTSSSNTRHLSKAEIFANFDNILSSSNTEKVNTDFGSSTEATKKLQELDKLTFKIQMLKTKEFSDGELNQIDMELTGIQRRLLNDQTAPVVDRYANDLLNKCKQILDHLRPHQKVSSSFLTTMRSSLASLASWDNSSQSSGHPQHSPYMGNPSTYLGSSRHQYQVSQNGGSSSTDTHRPAAVQQTEITQGHAQKTKVIFPLGIDNGKLGSCYVKSSIQGLMGSQSFLNYLDSIEEQMKSSSAIVEPNELLNKMLEIKQYWNSSNITLLNQWILDLRWLLQQQHPYLSRERGGEIYTDFLKPFLEDIGYIPKKDTLTETTPPAATFILQSHLKQHRSLLKDVIQADLGPAFAKRDDQPNALILYVSLNSSDNNNGLRFPRTGLIELSDSENKKHTYRFTSFSRMGFQHYTQFLNFNNQWYEFDTRVTRVNEEDLKFKIQRAYILYFDKVQDETSEVIVEPLQTPPALSNFPTTSTTTSQTFSDSPAPVPHDVSLLLNQITTAFTAIRLPTDPKVNPVPVSVGKPKFETLPVLHLKSTIPTTTTTTLNSTQPSPISSTTVTSSFSSPLYEGERKEKFYHGKGKLILPTGEIKEGHFAYGQFKKGTITYPAYDEKSEEQGQFLREEFLDGDGCTRKYRSGMIEHGTFSRGKFQQGTRTHADGRVENI